MNLLEWTTNVDIHSDTAQEAQLDGVVHVSFGAACTTLAHFSTRRKIREIYTSEVNIQLSEAQSLP